MRIPKAKYLTVVLLAIASFALQQARADFVSSIGVGNSDLSGFQGPFGFVTIDLTSSTTADVTFTSNTVGANTYLFGDGQAADLNVNVTGTTFSISGLSGTGPNNPPVLTSVINLAGTPPLNGFGDFNLQISDFDGFMDAASSITFTLTNVGGTWSSAANVLAFNTGSNDPRGPFDAGMHVFVTTSGGTVNTGFTGKAAENAAGVPEGGTTAMLLGIALTAFGAVRRFAII